jgi:hypothetical protein
MIITDDGPDAPPASVAGESSVTASQGDLPTNNEAVSEQAGVHWLYEELCG